MLTLQNVNFTLHTIEQQHPINKKRLTAQAMHPSSDAFCVCFNTNHTVSFSSNQNDPNP